MVAKVNLQEHQVLQKPHSRISLYTSLNMLAYRVHLHSMSLAASVLLHIALLEILISVASLSKVHRFKVLQYAPLVEFLPCTNVNIKFTAQPKINKTYFCFSLS